MIGDNDEPAIGSRRRILIVHRYYWPDTAPCAVLLSRIAVHLKKDGHNVEVLSSQPSYRASGINERRKKREIVDGVLVDRLKLPTEVGRPSIRIFNAFRLGMSLFYRSITRRYDIIMVSTVPPVLGGFFSALAAKITGARFIYQAMDIHPEAGRVSGEFANPVVFKILQKLDSWSCGQARPVVVLSNDMKKTLKDRDGGESFYIEVINNFALPDSEVAQSHEPYFLEKKSRLTVIYAGNLGKFQGLDTIVAAMEILRDRNDIELVIMGDGVEKPVLEERVRASGANVSFLGSHPISVAKSAIRQSDIGFVSLVEGVYQYSYPSKTMSYLEQGCPIIAAVEEGSELAKGIRESGCGISVPPGDALSLASLLVKLSDDSDWKLGMRENAERMIENDFSEVKILQRWSNLVAE